MLEVDLYKTNRGKQSEIVGKPTGFLDYDSTLTLTKRAPLEGNRIFKTKAHMLAYIEDRLNTNGTINENSTESTVKTALPGIILTVVDDDEDSNNGMYYIENADPNATPGLSAIKINITGPIPNEKIDLLFSEESGETGGTEVTEE
jgi:hypothetical protein